MRLQFRIKPLQPLGALALRLLDYLDDARDRPLVYVARGPERAQALARIMSELDPDLRTAVLPPWDNLPYDRKMPSAAAMGVRMGLMRWLLDDAPPPDMIFTTPPALLRRVPPRAAQRDARMEFRVGDALEAEIADRFGPPPESVESLLMSTLLRTRCRELGIARLDGGPQALAASFREDRRRLVADARLEAPLRRRDNRVIFAAATQSSSERLAAATTFLERLAELVRD